MLAAGSRTPLDMSSAAAQELASSTRCGRWSPSCLAAMCCEGRGTRGCVCSSPASVPPDLPCGVKSLCCMQHATTESLALCANQDGEPARSVSSHALPPSSLIMRNTCGEKRGERRGRADASFLTTKSEAKSLTHMATPMGSRARDIIHWKSISEMASGPRVHLTIPASSWPARSSMGRGQPRLRIPSHADSTCVPPAKTIQGRSGSLQGSTM